MAVSVLDTSAVARKPTASVPIPLAKRALDVLLSGTDLLLSSPLWAALAAAIKLNDVGPVFFSQERVGAGGRVFHAWKFRSMIPDAEKHVGAMQATEHDPRVTAIGRIMRATAMDELPQLWNILRGHMSLIGPRPEQPALVGHYREKLPLYDLRHSVAPGLSGWAQVNYGYAADLAETARKLDYDLEYVRNYGPKMDFVIVVKTFRIFLDPRFVR